MNIKLKAGMNVTKSTKLILIAVLAGMCVCFSGCSSSGEDTGTLPPTEQISFNSGDENIEMPDESEIHEPDKFIFNATEGKMFMENINVEYNVNGKYYSYANKAVEDLIANYWHEKRGIFYDTYPQKTGSAFNYWWYAHGIDVFADAYIRTGNEVYREYADKVVENILKRNKTIVNDYYDDMEWMALALIRFYDETKDEKYLEYVNILWEDIKGGWNSSMGGGIAWRKPQLDYKNTPANAPAAILAARLYRILGNEEDFRWAEKIYQFQKDNLVNNVSGQVWDGINREGNGKVDKEWNFTYCHGVYIGAGVELYKITGDETYLEDAKRTAVYSLKTFFDEKNGTFTENGQGDGGLFKGILTRYITELYLICPDMADIKDKLEMCAETLHDKGTNEEGYFSSNGYKMPSKGYDLSLQLSGVMLYEMMAKIESAEHID